MRAILDREFFGFARTRRFFLVRMAVFLFPFVLFVGIAWRMDGLPGDVVGVTIHHSTMVATLLAALCVTPGMLAHVVPQERRRNRLEVLRSTPLSARQLVLGKYLSRVGLVTLTVIAALSLPALALLFGGISPGQLLRGAAVVLATVAWTGAMALFTSASRTELGPASRVAYASTALFCVLPLIGWTFFGVVMATGLVAPWTFDQFVWIGSCVNPFFALGSGARTVAFGGTDPAIGYGVFSAVVTGLALRGAIRRVRRDPKPAKRPGRSVPALRPDGTRTEVPVPAAESAAAIDADPLRWLEERRPGLLRRRKRFLAALVGIELLNLLWWGVAGTGIPGNALIAVLALIHAAFLAAIEGATAFRRDEEANTLDVLHATPLRSAQLARAKIAAAGRAWRGWWFLGALHAVMAAF
ncbi:MAG: ABC transporter permease, partial [Planctomycetota bacterium JB042]